MFRFDKIYSHMDSDELVFNNSLLRMVYLCPVLGFIKLKNLQCQSTFLSLKDTFTN